MSLGATRVLRLENAADPGEAYALPVPSGSVYIQRWVFPEYRRWQTLSVSQ